MDVYKMKVFPSAKIDILDIVDHFNTLAPDAATQAYDRFVEQIGTLTVSPERCPLAKDTQLRLRGYRTFSVDDYTVFFVLRAETVDIRRILYSKRQYERLF